MRSVLRSCLHWRMHCLRSCLHRRIRCRYLRPCLHRRLHGAFRFQRAVGVDIHLTDSLARELSGAGVELQRELTDPAFRAELILLLDVLEHVEDPVAMLTQLSRERLAAVLDALAARWPEARADRRDGLRLDWADRWLHVRGSNTEPVVRVIAEAPSAEGAAALCRDAGEVLSAG